MKLVNDTYWKINLKTIIAILIGIMLFFILGRFVIIPEIIKGTNTNIQYGLLGFMAALFGPIAGFIIGFAGHFFIDFFANEINWAWIISSGIFGFLVGLLGSRTRLVWGQFGAKGAINFNIAQFVSHLICWGVIAPVLDILIYKETAKAAFTQGLTAALMNIITTAILGTILCYAWANAIPDKATIKK